MHDDYYNVVHDAFCSFRRRAVEIIESKKTSREHSKSNAQVTISIIEQVVKEMSSSPTIAFVSNASIHQKIFLWSLLQRTRVTGLAEVELGEVFNAYDIDR